MIVRELTARERDSWEESCLKMKGKGKNRESEVNLKNARARLVVRSCIKEDGVSVFTEADAELLGGLSAAAVDRIYTVAARLSGISEEDLEEIAGNSESDPSDDSSMP